MKTLIVYAHPRIFSEPTQKEPIRNKMIIDKLSKLPNVTYKDIYLILNGNADFTPEQIKTEVEDIKKYDRIIIQSPLFWYNVSHIGKLYLDQILTRAFMDLKGKELGVIFTTGAPISYFKSLETLNLPIKMSAEYAQMKVAKMFVLGADEGEAKINEMVEYYSK